MPKWKSMILWRLYDNSEPLSVQPFIPARGVFCPFSIRRSRRTTGRWTINRSASASKRTRKDRNLSFTAMLDVVMLDSATRCLAAKRGEAQRAR